MLPSFGKMKKATLNKNYFRSQPLLKEEKYRQISPDNFMHNQHYEEKKNQGFQFYQKNVNMDNDLRKL